MQGGLEEESGERIGQPTLAGKIRQDNKLMMMILKLKCICTHETIQNQLDDLLSRNLAIPKYFKTNFSTRL